MEPQLPSANNANASQFADMVHHLLEEAREKGSERRTEKREPFFQVMRLSFAGEERRQFTCFSRDISPTGIGLLHYLTVEPGKVILTIPSRSCGDLRIGAEIMWCQPCGEGWYVSGAKFLEILGKS